MKLNSHCEFRFRRRPPRFWPFEFPKVTHWLRWNVGKRNAKGKREKRKKSKEEPEGKRGMKPVFSVVSLVGASWLLYRNLHPSRAYCLYPLACLSRFLRENASLCFGVYNVEHRNFGPQRQGFWPWIFLGCRARGHLGVTRDRGLWMSFANVNRRNTKPIRRHRGPTTV